MVEMSERSGQDLAGRTSSSIGRNDDTGTFFYSGMQMYGDMLICYAELTYNLLQKGELNR